MYRLAKFRLTMRVRVLTASSRLKGVMVGLILTVFFTGDQLLRCDDVETNPGSKSDNMRQTRLNSGNRSDTTPTATPRNDPTGTETEPTLKDVMSLLMSMNSKFNDMKMDMNEMVKFFNVLFHHGIYPDRWTESIIVPLFIKKGNQNDPKNY